MTISKREGKRIGHAPEFDDTCSVCLHEHREQIERLYHGWHTFAELTNLTQIEEPELKKHMRAMGKHLDRSKNIDELAAIGMERALERGILDELDADQLIKLMQLRGKLDGRIDSGRRDEGPRTVVIVGFPAPGGILPANTTEQVAAGKVQLLPPGAGESPSVQVTAKVIEEKNGKGT